MTPEQRSRCMAAIKGKDTKPEMLVRKFLFAKGLRYRINCRRLAGTPDIVLKKYKTVVFIDGCFWHGHEGCRFYRLPKTNVDFWRHKIYRNRAKDYINTVELRLAGWKVIRVWECDVRTKAKREETLEHLFHEITGESGTALPDEPTSPTTSVAAEPNPPYGDNLILIREKIQRR